MRKKINYKKEEKGKNTSSWYGKEYFKEEYAFAKERRKIFQYHLDALLSMRGKIATILDVGCGLGCFLNLCDALGIETYGLEISDFALKEAKKNTKAEIKKSINLDSLFTDKQFDVVTVFDLMEHIDNDEEILKFIYDRLKKDGVLYGTTPNKECLLNRLLGEGDSTHINVHTASYWFNLLDKTSFKNIEIKYIFSFGFPPGSVLKSRVGIISVKPIFTPFELLGQEILFVAVK